MEIPDLILTQALLQSKSSSINAELGNALKKLESKTPEDLFNGDSNEEMLAIDNEIRNIITANVYANHKSESDKISVTAQIIFTAAAYLRKGISSGDITAILIFLGVNCYLQIEIEKLLSKSELEDLYTKSVSEKIVELLKSIRMEAQSLPDAPYHEKEMINESVEGFAQNNIAKTYNLIEGVERSGRGFHFNFLLEHLVSFLYRLNFPSFINALSYLQNPTDFVFYFQSFKKEDLLKIANESSLSNKWLNFEVIRQIVKREDTENIYEPEVDVVKNILNRIEIIDFDFLKQTAKYFQRSKLFNASLGTFLSSSNDTQIKEIVSDFTIDKYSSNMKTRDVLREYFIRSASDIQFDLIHDLIYKKWKNFFNDILATENFFQNSLVLTDFANFISNYNTHLVNNQDLLTAMEILIEKISFVNSEWTSSKSEQITKFHLYLSELFLLTFAYRNKRLNDAKIMIKYEKTICNKIQLSRYVSVETEEYFEQGKRNINWTKEYEV